MSLIHLSLRSGRTAAIADIRLTPTYGDMLEGYPFSRLNDMKLSALLHQATRAFPDHPVHVVPPLRELPDLPAGAFGPVETLPPVAVIALLTSEPVDPARDDVSFYSALAVVWLQDEPVIPSGATIDPALLVLPWTDLAQDYER
ncbi:hypothetical protein ACFWBC_00570 [Streptomyces sp. NPDC059985]|uniref:hypothetical protein n=1 Tax=Streptomyces sp. NPDC059985 TaxID=3347025 RepID=UPI0036847B09